MFSIAILYYPLLFLVFSLPPAAAAALWHFLRRRKARGLPYRKRVLRRTAGAAALVGVYSLLLLGLFVSVGYYPALSALVSFYDEGAHNFSIDSIDNNYYDGWLTEDIAANYVLESGSSLLTKYYPAVVNATVFSEMDFGADRAEGAAPQRLVSKKIPMLAAKLYRFIASNTKFLQYASQTRGDAYSPGILFDWIRWYRDWYGEDYDALENVVFIVPEQEGLRKKINSLFSDRFTLNIPFATGSITQMEWDRQHAMRYFSDRYGIWEENRRDAAEIFLRTKEQWPDDGPEYFTPAELDAHNAAEGLTDEEWYRLYATKYSANLYFWYMYVQDVWYKDFTAEPEPPDIPQEGYLDAAALTETEWNERYAAKYLAYSYFVETHPDVDVNAYFERISDDEWNILSAQYRLPQKVLALGADEVDASPALEQGYIHAAAAPLLSLTLSDIDIPVHVAIGSPITRNQQGGWISLRLDTQANDVKTCLYIALVLILLTNIIAFSRHERHEAQRRAQLLLDVAHELKTPMGSVMLKGEEVLEGETLEDKNQSAEEMIEQIERMRGRLNEVLQNARLESMGVCLQYEAFSLREAAEDAMDQVAALAEGRALSMQLEGEDIAMEADRTYIVRAVFNFLTNAIKNTPEGGRIVCRLRREGNSALCGVYNSGSSIPPKEMKKIWQQFYKISDGGDNARKGTGVGLSTVKSIVALHGGTYGCRNTEDGVEFWFRIPVKRKGRGIP